MSVSIWQRGEAEGPVERCGLAVVGGGIAGLAAALQAQRLGISVRLVERHTIGSGASGRNAGYLMRGMADTYAVASRSLGLDTARAIWRLSEDNLAMLRAEGVERLSGYAKRPSCLLSFDADEEDDLRQSHEMLREDGFASELLEADAIPSPVGRRASPTLGLVNPGDAVCDPVQLVGLLRSKLSAGTECEGDEAVGLRPERDRVMVSTRHGVLEADGAIVCTNAWLGELVPWLAETVVSRRAQMLAARCDSGPVELPHAYYLNRGNEYLRSGPGGLLLMGGARRFEPADQSGDQSGTAEAVQAELERVLAVLVTDRFQVVRRWSGVMGFSPDGLPLAGPCAANDRVWVCGGFTGHGMSLAFAAASHAVRRMLAGESGEAMFDPARFA